MQSYIVRIYRNAGASETAAGSDPFLGLVEHAESGERQVFRTLEDLWAILRAGPALGRRGEEPKDPSAPPRRGRRKARTPAKA